MRRDLEYRLLVYKERAGEDLRTNEMGNCYWLTYECIDLLDLNA